MFNILDRISLIAKGDLTEDLSTIDALATQGRQLLEYQYSHGLNQDFRCGNRLAKEELVRGKKNRSGHKGGRGGVNAPKRRAIEMDGGCIKPVDEDISVHLGDDYGDNVVDEVGISNAPHSANMSLEHNVCLDNTSIHTKDYEAMGRGVNFTPPSFRLLSSSDFQWPPQPELIKEKEQATEELEQQVNGDTSVHTKDDDARGNGVEFTHPSFQLLSSTDFQWPPFEEHASQLEQT
ncbi:uncharacterized protein LOC141668432 [Apium graveolens]|uniref:uncharacterized protein LOC141668432 n=1 Tax=Apium graveolens TaxID=4045 RepID=UPI003D79C260